MIDHVSITVCDLARAMIFYEKLLATLDFTKLSESSTAVGFGKKYPEFWVNLRDDANAPSGTHIALRAPDTEAVRAFHSAALENGGTCDGLPGMRKVYAPNYYAAFVSDPDGNRIEAVTFIEDKGLD